MTSLQLQTYGLPTITNLWHPYSYRPMAFLHLQIDGLPNERNPQGPDLPTVTDHCPSWKFHPRLWALDERRGLQAGVATS